MESGQQPVVWWRIGRRWLATFALAMIMLPAALSMPVARAAALSPGDDPFDAAPTDLGSHSNGAVLGARTIRLLGLPIPVAAWQLRYRTTDSEQHPQLDVTTVLVPPVPWSGPRPMLSYQVPENSLDTSCAPSSTLRGGPADTDMVRTMQDAPFIGEALLRGWAVVVSDYEGPQSRFYDGVTSGRGVLDGIRAARSFPPAGIDASSPIGAWGYSSGAFATLWAAQLRREYAPDVRFAGVSAGGVPTDLPAMAQLADGGGGTLLMLGLARDEPGSRLADLLNDRGRRALLATDTAACGADQKYFGIHADDFASVPNLLEQPAFRNAATPNELGRAAPDTPLYLYHSVTDEKIPVAGYTALVHTYCAQGATLTAVHSLFPTHIGAAAGEAFGAMNFLADRFAGIPQAPGCVVR
jgi:hypothetical protein